MLLSYGSKIPDSGTRERIGLRPWSTTQGEASSVTDFRVTHRTQELECADWADLTEDKVINPAPGFWPIFGPLGPTAGPGSLGTGSGSKDGAGCTKHQARKQIICSIRGHRVFGAGRKKITR